MSLTYAETFKYMNSFFLDAPLHHAAYSYFVSENDWRQKYSKQDAYRSDLTSRVVVAISLKSIGLKFVSSVDRTIEKRNHL